MPAIDFSGYRCRAVIDWVDAIFSLGRKTQFRFLQGDLLTLAGRRLWVRPLDPGPGSVATRFCVRFQEPRLQALAMCAEIVEAKYGLVLPALVPAAEFSVDFTPTIPSEESRALMVGVLTHHHFPNRDFIKVRRDRPRFNWGPGAGKTRHVLRSGASESWDNMLLMSSYLDEQSPIDATFYVGRKDGRAMWRVQEKMTDQRNPGVDARVHLSDEAKRARVEVTLDRTELLELGVDTLENLRDLNFSRLQGRHFRFMLPTFRHNSTERGRRWR